MRDVTAGRYRLRQAQNADDVEAALALRERVFRAKSGARDEDAFDARCTHVLIEGAESGELVCCYRLLRFRNGRDIKDSYSAQFYDLSALSGFAEPMVEMGRFCVDPIYAGDPDILRLAWAGLAREVDAARIEMLFGCTSFGGTETGPYRDAFALLRDRHLAPRRWEPKVKAPKVFHFANSLRHMPDQKQALAKMPPLLRSYLRMGGWVSDHAVVDRDLNTLHVFTGLEVSAIPPARAKALRLLAA